MVYLLDTDSGIVKGIVRFIDEGLVIFKQIDFLGMQQAWSEKIVHEDSNNVEVVQHAFKMPKIKEYDQLKLSEGGELWVLKTPDSYDSVLKFKKFDFKLSEFSQAKGK